MMRVAADVEHELRTTYISGPYSLGRDLVKQRTSRHWPTTVSLLFVALLAFQKLELYRYDSDLAPHR